MFRLSAQGRVKIRGPTFEKRVPYHEPRMIRRAVKNTRYSVVLKYLGTERNGKFKRMEPHFQLSATRSASQEGTETAFDLPHSRECTKEPIPALPNYSSKEKFGARAEIRNVLQEKLTGRGGSSCRFDRFRFFSLWAMQHRSCQV